jgi:hypothetical protein
LSERSVLLNVSAGYLVALSVPLALDGCFRSSSRRLANHVKPFIWPFIHDFGTPSLALLPDVSHELLELSR